MSDSVQRTDSPSPDTVRDLVDRGDDTQRRFHYQYCCILILLGDLVDPTPEYTSFYCEQADDLLGKRIDGKFTAFQVKSREKHFGPLSATDREFRSWIAHFCRLEERFADHFRYYVLLYSNGFIEDDTYGAPVLYAERLATCDLTRRKKYDTKELIRLSTEIGYDPQLVQRVLGKMRFQNAPELASVKSTVLHKHFFHLSPRLRQHSLPHVTRAFDLIISRIESACNLTNNDPREHRCAMYTDPDKVLTDAIIKGKTVDHEMFVSWLEECVALAPEALLTTYDPRSLSDLIPGTNRLLKKFAAGQLDVDNYEIATDLKASAEEAFLNLPHVLNDERTALQLYNSLRIAVRNQCQESYDSRKKAAGGQPFGTDMLIDVRTRLKELSKTPGMLPQRSGLVYEHLLGLCFCLTEECKVWWSPKFDLEGA